MTLVRILLAPFLLLIILSGCDKPQAPPAPKLDTVMPAPDSTQPTMQSTSPNQR
ncbi:hypothetical protein [Oxalicibacterium faecigallinarum]|uniref:Lipoprotein n=1 Tax=Oxalicibacterium faecigallinarum TaxID=573741 RepID=A0A8J3ATX4_9BURK|nr:hypothetical protein [Oxalicibacterium faecigallinarum]GGI19210.1 hypothetical protein GCM10008066_17940 [Oxalicibacterium faecigallinarum]